MNGADNISCVALSEKQLSAIEGRARELEALGTQCDADEKALQSVDEAYKLYGIRSFPVADYLARFDIPMLVAELRAEKARNSRLVVALRKITESNEVDGPVLDAGALARVAADALEANA